MLSLETFQSVLNSAAVMIPVIVGAVSAIRMAVPQDISRYLPLISMAVGGLLALVFLPFTVGSMVVGMVMGLASTGSYEFVKTTMMNR